MKVDDSTKYLSIHDNALTSNDEPLTMSGWGHDPSTWAVIRPDGSRIPVFQQALSNKDREDLAEPEFS